MSFVGSMEMPAKRSLELGLEELRGVVIALVEDVEMIENKLDLGVKIDAKCQPFPEFDKEKLEYWLSKVDHFFRIERVRDDQNKIRIAAYHLDVEAFGWHRKIIANHGGYNLTWPDYVASLKQLCEEALEPPMMHLMRLRQQPGTPVEEFNLEFNYIVAGLRHLDRRHVLEAYLASLDPDIAIAVKKESPRNFEYAQKLALSIELSRARGEAL